MKLTSLSLLSFAFHILQITKPQARFIWDDEYGEDEPEDDPSTEEDNKNMASDEELSDIDTSDTDNNLTDQSVTSIELGRDNPSDRSDDGPREN